MLEAERALVAALLGEATPREAADRMCAAFSRLPGVTCALLDGHQPRRRAAADDGTVHLFLGDTTDETARTLVITQADALPAETLDRAKRLFERLVDIAYPIRRGGRAIHQLNNGLAGLAANIELMELLVADAASGSLDEPQRQELSTAIAYALESCRALKATIRTLSGLVRGQQPPADPGPTRLEAGTSTADPPPPSRRS
jgi:hypothetical protein